LPRSWTAPRRWSYSDVQRQVAAATGRKATSPSNSPRRRPGSRRTQVRRRNRKRQAPRAPSSAHRRWQSLWRRRRHRGVSFEAV